MSKKPEILTDYLRNNAEGFSLASKGQETDIEDNKCNFYTDRQGSSPQYIMQTYYVGDLQRALSKMLSNEENISESRKLGVSVNYLIDKDGSIYQLVPDSKKPWTAGQGSLKTGSKLNQDIPNDMKNVMNDYCISIMSINSGKEPLTAEQIEANLLLTKYLRDEYKIESANIVGLADWAVGRHIAPGPYFPWKEFSKHNLGLWSDVELKDYPEVIVSWKKKADSKEVVEDIQQQFAELGMIGTTKGDEGYLDSATLSNMLSFNLHYFGSEIINNPYLNSMYDEHLWQNSNDPDARGVLGEWNENSQAVLDDILS
ncbi:MAG: N-acetylmuramoyl-L-alanine amidase [Candidatus Tisiphia sp.]|nr:N-acetylmuramoyl-L-alanine amidase [Candidatus Tisiphia sp.]